MDSFDLIAEPAERKRKIGAIGAGLAILAVLAVFCVGAAYMTLRINPRTSLNVAPPPTMNEIVPLPSIDATPEITPTTAPKMTATQAPGRAIAPTETSKPTKTSTLAPPTATPTEVLPTPTYSLEFELQPGNPVALPNIGHPDAGCNWAGVAGQATGIDGVPIVGLFVKLIGVFDDQTKDLLTLTGAATQYGMGGYEFTLGDRPAYSSGTLQLQLYDQAMIPLSPRIQFDTYEDCEQNLILINFVQSK